MEECCIPMVELSQYKGVNLIITLLPVCRVLYSATNSIISIQASEFNNNMAAEYGGVLYSHNSTITVSEKGSGLETGLGVRET